MSTPTTPVKAKSVERFHVNMSEIHLRIYDHEYRFDSTSGTYMKLINGVWSVLMPTLGIKRIIDEEFKTYVDGQKRHEEQMAFLAKNPGYVNKRERYRAAENSRGWTNDGGRRRV